MAQLSLPNFHEFMNQAAILQPVPAEAPRLSWRETALLKINAGPPPEWQTRYQVVGEMPREPALDQEEAVVR